ncbi:MAG: type VI secretion system baseplate subunit TssF [Bryobacterales bacterium]|nr:type VI secretion system baseplate subunit TssF [Bryobacterales bacterium]
MRDELLLYYERELTFLRQMGVEFAEKYPKIASRLVLEPDKCDDPHVERILEAFAFLAARVHLKIDDEFPEITESLLNIVYPHYVRPIPSMSIAEFRLDPAQTKNPAGTLVPRDAKLLSRPVAGVPCRFRTCYDTTLWPLEVVAGEWKTPDRLQPAIKAADAVGAFRVELKCHPDVKFDQLQMKTARFYLNGESNLINIVYELLCANLASIWIRDPSPNSRVKPVELRADSLTPVGFGEREGMLALDRRSFRGYALLQEYFNFPEKFFFIDIRGLDRVWSTGFKERAEIVFLISPFERTDRKQNLEMGVTASTFRLGCTPIVNLFGLTAEPILLDQKRFEYQVVPDVRRPNAHEVFSIDEVFSIAPGSRELLHFEPFYSFRHSLVREKKSAYWSVKRRPSGKANDEGTEMYISLVDLSGRPVQPELDTLTLRVTCSNRDLPARLPFGNESGDFELEEGAFVRSIIALHKPTTPLRPATGRGAFWRLISHLSLNYLSLVNEGKDALQEILRLYNATESTYAEKQIQGIATLSSKAHFSRVISENGISFARGTHIDIEFDEEQFVGGGVYLFASVLEHFFGLYVSLNSFSKLTARTRQRKEVMKQWPPRAGQRILL